MFRKLTGAALALCLSFATGAAQAQNYKPLEGDPKEISFGIIATDSTQVLKEQWLPFVADMEKQLGMPVKAFFAPDYAGVIEAMRFGKVHVAWFGNKSGMEAVDRAGGEVFAQERNKDGTQGYYSHVIVNADNKDINSLKDLLKCDRQVNFGMGDPNSTSGFLVPSFYVFAKNKVETHKCFKTVRNASHGANLAAVANNQVHAATNNSAQIARTKAKAPEMAKKVKVIWTSPLIPSDPMVYRKDLSKDLKAKIKGFFLSYGRIGPNAEKERKVLAGISDGLGPYTDSSNAQLYPIRQLALFKEKVKLQSDKRLDPAEKAKKIKEIDETLAKLEVLSSPGM